MISERMPWDPLEECDLSAGKSEIVQDFPVQQLAILNVALSYLIQLP